jgi:hypothetical protein
MILKIGGNFLFIRLRGKGNILTSRGGRAELGGGCAVPL